MVVASKLRGGALIASLSCGSTIAALLVAPVARAQTQAQAQAAPLTQGLTDLPRALDRIGRHFAVAITYDRGDVGESPARPVRRAATAYDAVVQATDGTGLSYQRNADGSIHIFRREGSGGDILVIARRDEAETNLNVNSAASSTRTGKSLREQPRSTTVVGAKLIEDQQVQSIQEALRNVSGTTAGAGTQGVPNFTVRGYVADALANGLRSGSAGAQPVAGLERIEVLKGPDVVLAGANNLGGVVNIVTKRPTASPLLNVALEYATFDDKRITVDASNALNDDRTISARITATAAKAERSYQGYDGREEYLFAPALRYKTADSDLIVGMSTSSTFSPIPSATIVDKSVTDRQVIRPFRESPLGPRRQGVRLGVTREYFNFTQRVADWLTLVARGEHSFTTTDIRGYLPGNPVGLASNNLNTYFAGPQLTRSSTDALDAYARLNFGTGPIRHTVTAGYNFSRDKSTTLLPASSVVVPAYNFNLVTGAATNFNTGAPVTNFPALPGSTVPNYFIPRRQGGFYIQDFIEFGRLKLIGALRVNKYNTGITFFDPALAASNYRQDYSSTLPSFGAVYDVLDNLSVYANFQRGYVPGNPTSARNRSSTVEGAFTGAVFPDGRTKNIEGGVKVDLFDKKLAVVASYYQNRQSNFVDTSSVPGTAFLIPGQLGKGFEMDVSGRILSGWSVVASASHTEFSAVKPTPAFMAVRAQPETKYSLFTSYEPTSGSLAGFGASAGIYGSSSSFAYAGVVDPANRVAAFNNGAPLATRTYAAFRPFVPGSRQVDANLYYTMGIARLTLGVKNLFDRRNYQPAQTFNFIPVADPRTVRATLAFRFY